MTDSYHRSYHNLFMFFVFAASVALSKTMHFIEPLLSGGSSKAFDKI